MIHPCERLMTTSLGKFAKVNGTVQAGSRFMLLSFVSFKVFLVPSPNERTSGYFAFERTGVNLLVSTENGAINVRSR